MLVYLWGVGHQERQQRQTDSYGRTPWSGSVWASPGALGRLRRAARRWRNGAGTLAEWCRNAGGMVPERWRRPGRTRRPTGIAGVRTLGAGVGALKNRC